MLLDIQDFDYFSAYIRFDELKEYLDVTDNYLRKAKKDFKAWAHGEITWLPLQLQQELYKLYSDEYQRHSERFPRILRNSFLVSALSLLEYEIHVICIRLKKEYEIPIGWNDLRGDTLDRAKLYCKLAHLDPQYDDQTWKEINHYSKVRNCIVHRNGLLKEFEDDQDFITYVNRKGIISKDTKEQEIALTEQFCTEVVETIKAFLEKLYKGLAK